MILGIVGENKELTVNPVQFLFGRTIKGSKLEGMTGKLNFMFLVQRFSALKLREDLECFGSLAILPAVKLVRRQSLERKVRNVSMLKMVILLLLRNLQVVEGQVGLMN